MASNSNSNTATMPGCGCPRFPQYKNEHIYVGGRLQAVVFRADGEIRSVQLRAAAAAPAAESDTRESFNPPEHRFPRNNCCVLL